MNYIIDTMELEEKITVMMEMHKKVHSEVQDNIARAQEKQKKLYDSKHNNRTELKVA